MGFCDAAQPSVETLNMINVHAKCLPLLHRTNLPTITNFYLWKNKSYFYCL